jgi:hypothetical protein
VSVIGLKKLAVFVGYGNSRRARCGIRRKTDKLHFLFFSFMEREMGEKLDVINMWSSLQDPGLFRPRERTCVSAVQIKLAIAQHGFGNELFLQALIAWSFSCDFSLGPHAGEYSTSHVGGTNPQNFRGSWS